MSYLPVFRTLDTHKCTQTHTNTRRHTQIHVDTHKYTQTHTNTRRHTQIHADTHKYTQTHTNTRRHTQIHAYTPAQGWNNRTLAVHERFECRFLELPGSRSTITEMTEYTYFSLLKPRREFEYKSE